MPCIVNPSILPDDVLLTDVRRFEDARGFFSELYSQARLPEALPPFVQDNVSLSTEAGVLRGLHFQTPPYAQGKLLTVIQGAILDVIVDLRSSSKTFGCAYAFELSSDNQKQLYVPEGFAHGFLTQVPHTLVHYKVTASYQPTHDSGIAWNSPTLAIDWGLHAPPILSAKDAQLPPFYPEQSYF